MAIKDSSGQGRFRWFLVFLLFAVTIINYIDRSAISFAVHDIQQEFGFSASQIGLILGAFGIGYIISTLFGGLAADRFGSRLTLGVAAVVWSVAIGWTGLATGFIMVYAARVTLGFAEGPSFPAMTDAVKRWLPPEESATALAGMLVAVPIALAIGSPLVSQLISHFGWRGMFFILAALILLWLPFWIYYYTDRPSRSKHLSESEKRHIETALPDNPPSHGTDWRILLTTPTLLANYWAYFVFGYFLFFFMTWLPEYLRKTYHLDVSSVGLITILPWAVSAVLLYSFGYWSDATLRRTGSFRAARSYQIAGTQLLAALAIIPVVMTHDLMIAVGGITLAVGFALAANSAFYAVVTDLVPEQAGAAMGVMTIFFAASGFLAPVITGYALDITGDFRPAFWLISILALTSVLGVMLFHKPDRDRARLNP